MNRLLPYLMLLALALLWSSSFAAIKVAVATVPPVLLTAARILLAAAVLWGYARLRGVSLPGRGGAWVTLFFIGLFGNTAPFFLIAWGETTIGSGLAAILMAFMPIATVLLAHVFTADERINTLRAAGVGAGMTGVVVLIGVDALEGLGGSVWAQVAVAGGGICYAIANVLAKRLPPLPPESRAAGTMVCAAAQMVPVALVLAPPLAGLPGPAEMGWGLAAVAYLGLFPTALAAIILFKLIDRKGATFLSQVNYLIPALGVVWGVTLLGETVATHQVVALALILLGVGLTGRAQAAPAPSPKKEKVPGTF
ncbi:MAG: EamA family transporter [Hyphomicrobiales bacterium]|nr:EamA family transporter [Hyphomicrobiales bacterium]